ncbi:MAG TPA: pyridoxamine 5'-phosphate oxidase family protein [Clostridia bacterium]|nr:pyridoxamine 5'-phosphate oxidase family protein [Clostridia bacterium]
MFREMRRQDRKIDDKEAVRILEEAQYGILSTTGSSGCAYGVPLSYAYTDGLIYFHSATEGQKLDNISYNNKVSFCVVGKTTPLPQSFSVNYESVVVFGKAVEAFDEEKQAALEAIIAKYSPEFTAEGLKYIKNSSGRARIFKIEIEHMTGKARR